MNRDRNQHADQYERDRLIPNFRPEIEMRDHPTRNRLVVTQRHDQAQHPGRKVQHAVHKSTTITIEHTQDDRYDEQQIDRVNRHGQRLPSQPQSTALNRTYELSQFKIGNVTEFLDSLLGSLRAPLDRRSQLSAE